jgi:hypothetical protein
MSEFTEISGLGEYTDLYKLDRNTKKDLMNTSYTNKLESMNSKMIILKNYHV